MAKFRKMVFLSFSITCVVSIMACLIVDFAINRRITWSLYPILSVPFGWLILSPLLVKKHGVLLSLCSMTLFILPFLFLLDKITPVESWFMSLGILSAAVGAPAIWIIYLLLRFLKINMWYKGAIIVFLVGVVANPIINYQVDVVMAAGSISLSTVISAAGCCVLTVLLFLQGRKKEKIRRAYLQAEASNNWQQP